MTNNHQEDDEGLGYVFSPRVRPHAPGSPRLDIRMCETPTQRHFDPEKTHIQMAAGKDTLEHLTIYHPWTAEREFQVCAGTVTIEDRLGKKIEVFTFGGKLQVQSEPFVTICILRSPAPIVEMDQSRSVTKPSMLLVEETEILLVERKAANLPTEGAYAKKLIEAEPEILYASCLNELQDRYRRFPDGEAPHIREFKRFLREEVRSLKEHGQWLGYVPPLDRLL